MHILKYFATFETATCRSIYLCQSCSHACSCAMSRIIFTIHVVYMHNCRSSFVALRALTNKLYPRQTLDMTNVAYTSLCSECLMELSVCLRAEIKIEHITISSEQCHDIYNTCLLYTSPSQRD